MNTYVFRCPDCGSNECWFDRTIDCYKDEDGDVVEDGMHMRCNGCGKTFEELFPKEYENE